MRNAHVIAIDVATRAERDLTPAGNARYPSFSPNGRWCAYNSGGELWVVRADVDPLPAALPVTSTGGTVESASCFSPDSNWVYYLKNVAWDPYGGIYEVHRVHPDGTGDMLVTAGKNMTMLQFFPGTTGLGFIGPTSAGAYNLQGMSDTGGGVYNVTNLKPYKWMHGMAPASF